MLMVTIAALATITSPGLPAQTASPAGDYPRIGNLWGWEPSDTDYDKWAHYDLIVMAGSPRDVWLKFRSELKKRNPHCLVLGTAPFENVDPPRKDGWMKDEWYLRRPNGTKVSWWVDQLYAPNLFLDDYIDGAVNQADSGYGQLLREGSIDGFMFDSVVGNVRWYGDVDTDLDGKPDKPEDVDERWQQRQNLFFGKLSRRFPGAPILCNNVDLRHAPCVNGRLFEGSTLLDRLPTGYSSVQEAVHTLKTWMSKSRQPGVSLAFESHPIGWQWWRLGTTGKSDKLTTPGEIDCVRRDFARMRLGLTTTMMSDAYYCYDIGTTWYGYPLLYAEYDAPLGKPLGESKEVFLSKTRTLLDWQAGQPADVFKMTPSSKLTPSGIECGVDDKDAKWTLMLSTDPTKLTMKPGHTYRVIADLDVVRRPSSFFQVVTRSASGDMSHDRGARFSDQETGEPWHVEATVKLDDVKDYSIQLHQLGHGAVRLNRLKVMAVGDSYMVRRFEHGAVFVNPMPHAVTVNLDRPMRRLKDDAAPRCAIEIDDLDPQPKLVGDWEVYLQAARNPVMLTNPCSFSAGPGWKLRKEDGHHYGEAMHVADEAGKTADWSFEAPSTDEYTVYVWMRGGKEFAETTDYSLSGPGADVKRALDQRPYNGEWVKLVSARISKGKRYTVAVTSSGRGLTIADAIRVESKSRYNDGAPVTKLQLGALDGAILLDE